MTDMTHGKIVEVKDITVCFTSKGGSEHTAVDNISLSVNSGDTIAIVGESGSGKTTLLRALLGLEAPSSGYISLFGTDISSVSSSALGLLRRRCGYVQQDPYGALPPGLSAINAVVEPAVIAGVPDIKGEPLKKAKELLAELGLEDERTLSSRAAALSGGQRQRVQIARALLLSPDIILCDEPTSMQDLSTRKEIIRVLEHRVGMGMSMVFVTHDILLACKAARRIMVMKGGRLCEEGSSESVLNNPTHPYTIELMKAIPRFKR